jgi:fatty-acyl-CoA synthase
MQRSLRGKTATITRTLRGVRSIAEASQVQLSYVHGHKGAALTASTIGALLDDVAARHGERDAIVSVAQGIRWTYAELKSEADHLAAGFGKLGLARGDRIAIWSPTRAEWTAVQYAAAKAGLILVTVNPAYRTSELEYVLNAVGCSALVVSPSFKTSDYLAMVEEIVPGLRNSSPDISAPRIRSLRHVIVFGDDPSGTLLTYGSVRQLGARRSSEALPTGQCDDPINIQFTSGTTGKPKGVTLSHHNILNNAIQTGIAAGLREGDRVCIPVPLFHCFGMVVGNLACLGHAATAIYAGEAFDPVEVMAAVAAERCTHLYGVPTMMIAILGHPRFGDYDLSSLRGGIMGGAPCPAETMKSVISELHMPEVTIIYGMTETSPVSFQTRPNDPVEARVNTVGRVIPHIEAKIVDERDEIVPLGVTGQLCTRGYSVMSGYWNDPERTAEVLGADGWMHTGDLASLDHEGFCRISGRSKDIVIRGGENIAPREVEEYLYRHPAVRDVQVIGVPDPKFGEELCAWIVLKDGAAIETDDIREFCKGAIAHFKIPRYIRFVDGFPMTTSGKVQKFVMRERMIAELGKAPK